MPAAPPMLATGPRYMFEDTQTPKLPLERMWFNSSSVPRVSASEERVNGCWLN